MNTKTDSNPTIN